MRIYSEELRKNSSNKSPISSTSVSPSNTCSLAPNDTDTSPYSSHINRVHIPLIFNKNRPNISMFKFINSKGKQITKEKAFAHGLFEGSYNEIRSATKYVNSNPNFYRKRVPAIDKIQEELREMKQREDELRCQRVRTIGLSYPNLSSICDEDFTSDDQTIESSEENRDSFQSRCSSNPDLQNIRDTADSPNSETDSKTKVGGPRKKNYLIALWEQRIQEESDKK